MISATILTKNCQTTLAATLASVNRFPEVLIYDSGSTDQTLEIASKFPNVKIINGIFTGFGPTHNTASSHASHDWILSIDSDEILTPELIEEIFHLDLNPSKVYQINRKNYFNDKWIRWCGGWHPDPVVRLYNRRATRFTDDAVHEKVIVGDLKLTPPLFSPPPHPISLYGRLFEQNAGLLHSFCRTEQREKELLDDEGNRPWLVCFSKKLSFEKGIFRGKRGIHYFDL